MADFSRAYDQTKHHPGNQTQCHKPSPGETSGVRSGNRSLLCKYGYGRKHTEKKEVNNGCSHVPSKSYECYLFKVQNGCQTTLSFSTATYTVYVFMSTEMPDEFEAGDAVVVLGTPYDGKVATVLRATDDDNHYLVVLEDGKETVLSGDVLALRH